MFGLFVTGADTGVGKTIITAALARILCGQGRAVRVCKPVATGARQVGGVWISEDTVTLAHAAGAADNFHEITGWCFAAPAAPPVAARLAGSRLTLTDLVHFVRSQERPDHALLVEGVGGLLCPLTDDETVADLAAALALPLVIVTRRSLGTLNHTLLTLEVARARGLRIAGVVMNEVSAPASIAEETNVEELRRRMHVPLLAVVPFRQGETTHVLASAERALADVDWFQLCGQMSFVEAATHRPQ